MPLPGAGVYILGPPDGNCALCNVGAAWLEAGRAGWPPSDTGDDPGSLRMTGTRSMRVSSSGRRCTSIARQQEDVRPKGALAADAYCRGRITIRARLCESGASSSSPAGIPPTDSM